MNILPTTTFGTYHQSPDKCKTLIVWRKWLWFNYGHKEFHITGFCMGNNQFNNCKFGVSKKAEEV